LDSIFKKPLLTGFTGYSGFFSRFPEENGKTLSPSAKKFLPGYWKLKPSANESSMNVRFIHRLAAFAPLAHYVFLVSSGNKEIKNYPKNPVDPVY
jgi:hypothetical protein